MSIEFDGQSDADKERLYLEREKLAKQGTEPCVVELSVSPEVAPTAPKLGCDAPEAPQVNVFLPPNPAPDAPDDSDLLPAPLLVRNQQVSAVCPAGQVDFVDGNPSPFVVLSGVEQQSVFLDSIVPAIPQAELFRLASYVEQLQELVVDQLLDAIANDTLDAFDAEIEVITGTSSVVATAIRQELVSNQSLVDAIAQTIAETSIACGWTNRELWTVCSNDDPGYTIAYTAPVNVESRRVVAGVYRSTVSQVDADNLAALYAALALQCLVRNEEQTVTCSSEDILDEQTDIVWPVNWTLPTINPVTKNPNTRTLDSQGAASWDNYPFPWADFEFNTRTIKLNQLNGQQFMSPAQVNTPARRTLRTTVTVLAGTPEAAARTVEEANAIARNLAALQLDCFFPSRPRLVTCMSPTLGSTEVITRAAAINRSVQVEAQRTAQYAELYAVNPSTVTSSGENHFNNGVLGYGSATADVDDSQAFEVGVWPGFFQENNAVAANDAAGRYGAGLLLCNWISPAHNCDCIASSQEDVTQTAGFLFQQGSTYGTVDRSGVYQRDNSEVDGVSILGTPGGSPINVKLDASRSTTENSLPKGLLFSSTYPNAANSYAGTYQWADLAKLCQSSLSCYFVSCKIACCEPKADERPRLANGAANYASTNAALAGARQSDEFDHLVFMNSWIDALSSRSINACSISAAINFKAEDYEDCDLRKSNGVILPRLNASGVKAIVNPGPNDGNGPGMPARFKYGGLLKWGKQWASPSFDDDDDSLIPDLSVQGTVKGCHVADDSDDVVIPDIWGFYHCAEGISEGFIPAAVAAEAQNLAISRLDCTHIAWPRHMVLCSQADQKAWGPAVNFDIAVEGNSTGVANQTSELMLLPTLECSDSRNYMMQFSENILSITATSIVVVGATGCLTPGMDEGQFTDSPRSFNVDGGGHVMIVASCEGPTKFKRLNVEHTPDNSVTYQQILAAKQAGELGIHQGRSLLNTIQADLVSTGLEAYYIGSYHVKRVGPNAWQRITCQAHSGPIILQNSCCKNDSGSPPSEGGGGGESESSGSDGGGGDDSGSDKSTAIVPASWTGTGYVALFTDESPEVLFRDTVRVTFDPHQYVRKVSVDRRFLEVCEQDLVWVDGYSYNSVWGFAAELKKGILTVRRNWFSRARTAIVTLAGVRRGFVGKRFPARTREQFEANERFINSAYPKS